MSSVMEKNNNLPTFCVDKKQQQQRIKVYAKHMPYCSQVN